MKGFIFDMDGTIIDSMPYHTEAWVKFISGLGIDIDRDEFQRRTAGMTTFEILRRVVGDHLTEVELHDYTEQKETIYRAIYAEAIRPIDGLIEFLEASRALSVPMALATSAGKENLNFVLKHLEIEEYFTAIVCADEVRLGKPHPDMFLAASSKMGLESHNCVVFEDALLGIEAAQRAAMKAVVVMTTLEEKELQDFSHIITSIQDFSKLSPQKLLAQSA